MYQNPELWMLWCHLLLNATHKKLSVYSGHKRIDLEPGQYITGRNKLSAELSLSPRKIRTCLATLVRYENVTIQSTNKYSIITIVNWGAYQSDEEKTTNKATSHRPATDQPLTTKQECKNVKNDKKTTKADFVLPEWIDKDVWVEYKKYRQNGKGKFTPYAQELAIKKLEKLMAAGNDPNEVINQSVENGWSGLFPLKTNSNREESQEEWLKRVSQPR